MGNTPMTTRGAENLREELRRLKHEERLKISQAIAEARAHGDLSENAEYHAAREQQGFVEGRIATLEKTLSNARIIEPRHIENMGKVVFGATVVLLKHDSEKKIRYQIVGEEEANLDEGLISVNSPMARALIGHEAGEEVEVMAPGGNVMYEICEVLCQ